MARPRVIDRAPQPSGVARATLQRAFEELARAGTIETAYRSVTIAARSALERYVNQQ